MRPGRPDVPGAGNYLVGGARNLERAAGRVLNICEWIPFTVTGELL
ncbi:MAG TPA: hypothetical protein PKH77_22130 [Anaerolineae bacterium]|nr:hypothetical protein [Anaerolineae bacterium]